MKRSELKIGQHVLVCSDHKWLTHRNATVREGVVLDTRAWVDVSRSAPAREVELEDGSRLTLSARFRLRSHALPSRSSSKYNGAQGVLVLLPAVWGPKGPDRPEVVQLGHIRGEYESLAKEREAALAEQARQASETRAARDAGYARALRIAETFKRCGISATATGSYTCSYIRLTLNEAERLAQLLREAGLMALDEKVTA